MNNNPDSTDEQVRMFPFFYVASKGAYQFRVHGVAVSKPDGTAITPSGKNAGHYIHFPTPFDLLGKGSVTSKGIFQYGHALLLGLKDFKQGSEFVVSYHGMHHPSDRWQTLLEGKVLLVRQYTKPENKDFFAVYAEAADHIWLFVVCADLHNPIAIDLITMPAGVSVKSFTQKVKALDVETLFAPNSLVRIKYAVEQGWGAQTKGNTGPRQATRETPAKKQRAKASALPAEVQLLGQEPHSAKFVLTRSIPKFVGQVDHAVNTIASVPVGVYWHLNGQGADLIKQTDDALSRVIGLNARLASTHHGKVFEQFPPNVSLPQTLGRKVPKDELKDVTLLDCEPHRLGYIIERSLPALADEVLEGLKVLESVPDAVYDHLEEPQSFHQFLLGAATVLRTYRQYLTLSQAV